MIKPNNEPTNEPNQYPLTAVSAPFTRLKDKEGVIMFSSTRNRSNPAVFFVVWKKIHRPYAGDDINKINKQINK